MTGTAGSVKYHVSDFLQDRHPYNYELSYAAQRIREQGKVFNGLMPMGADKLLESLQDDQIEPLQKAVALKHLLALSAAAEKKVDLLRRGIVPILVTLLESNPVVPVEQIATQLFRSLCVIPQGIHCVCVEGGLGALTRMLSARHNAADREDARIAAASAIQLMTMSWAGRAWILGIDCPPDMELMGYDPAPRESSSEENAQVVCDVLVNVLEEDQGIPQLLVHALSSIASLTQEKPGQDKCLIGGALRAIGTILGRLAKEDTWVYSERLTESETVLYAATAVWHMALSEVGLRQCEELPFIQLISNLTAFVLPVKEKFLQLKAALAGAACALAMSTTLKLKATEATARLAGEPANLMEIMVQLLRQANDTYEPVYRAHKNQQPNPSPGLKLESIAAVIKNCVQAVRLIVELPSARESLKRMLPIADEYTLRRQLFYNTTFQQEFGVKEV